MDITPSPRPTLLVATTNPGKLREIQALLTGLAIDVRALAPDSGIEPPEETGETFAENARLKASYYAAMTGELTVAEDSGLEIDALDGAPGVLSARYPGTTYEERFNNLFGELAARGATRPAQRTARFVCALALATPASTAPAAQAASTATSDAPPPDRSALPPDGSVQSADGIRVLFEARGTVEGEIANEPRGTDGFGYDPIFYFPPYEKTLGEVTAEEKSRVSHRGAAFRMLRDYLAHESESA